MTPRRPCASEAWWLQFYNAWFWSQVAQAAIIAVLVKYREAFPVALWPGAYNAGDGTVERP